MFRSLWDGLRTSLSQGMEAEKLRTCGAALSIATDIWLELAQTLVKGAADASQRLGRPVKGLPQLTEEVAGVQEVRSLAGKLVDFVNAARSAPLDLKKLEQSEAAFAQGRFIKGKDVIARLRSRRAP